MKVFKYLFISSIMFAVTSCGNDWLDLAPSTQVDTETSINVLSDIEFTLNGIYSTMQSSDAYSEPVIITVSILLKTMVPAVIGHICTLLSRTVI